MQPANDNTPRKADSFANLSVRRQWQEGLSQSNPKPVLAWPTAERLARLESPDAVKALYSYAALMAPAHEVTTAEDGPSMPVDADAVKEIRPSVNEMLAAASSGLRCRVVSTRIDSRWLVVERASLMHGADDAGYRVGGLLFRNGRLITYGNSKPVERSRQPKGQKPQPRTETSIRYLLPANDNTPIAPGAGWLGGVTRMKGNTSKPDIGEHEAAVEIDRNARRESVRNALGLDAAVLDAAITDATARQIGEAFGFTGKTAERQGIARINAAIRKFQKIAA